MAFLPFRSVGAAYARCEAGCRRRRAWGYDEAIFEAREGCQTRNEIIFVSEGRMGVLSEPGAAPLATEEEGGTESAGDARALALEGPTARRLRRHGERVGHRRRAERGTDLVSASSGSRAHEVSVVWVRLPGCVECLSPGRASGNGRRGRNGKRGRRASAGAPRPHRAPPTAAWRKGRARKARRGAERTGWVRRVISCARGFGCLGFAGLDA